MCDLGSGQVPLGLIDQSHWRFSMKNARNFCRGCLLSAMLAIPISGHATTLIFNDLTDDVTLTVLNQPSDATWRAGNGIEGFTYFHHGENTPSGDFLGAAGVGIIEPGTPLPGSANVLSDDVSVQVSTADIRIDFRSDADTPLSGPFGSCPNNLVQICRTEPAPNDLVPSLNGVLPGNAQLPADLHLFIDSDTPEVPEPSSIMLFSSGIVTLVLLRQWNCTRSRATEQKRATVVIV